MIVEGRLLCYWHINAIWKIIMSYLMAYKEIPFLKG